MGLFVPVLFRLPDSCRRLWQARLDGYFSLFALESSGSHATLSHRKENNKSFLPVWNNRPAEGCLGCEYLLKVWSQHGWLTQSRSYRSCVFQHRRIHILLSCNYIILFIVYYLREWTDSFIYYFLVNGKKNWVVLQLYLQEHHCNVFPAPHYLQSKKSRSYFTLAIPRASWFVSRSSDKLENRDNA